MNTSTLAVGSPAGGITTKEKKVLTATLVGTAVPSAKWLELGVAHSPGT